MPSSYGNSDTDPTHNNQRRTRIYPRAHALLRILANDGTTLVRDDRDGRYRINGCAGRANTVILRTLKPLLRANVVRPVREGANVVITEHGKRIVKLFNFHVVDTHARRVMSFDRYERADPEQFGDIGQVA